MQNVLLAALTAFAIVLISGPMVIPMLHRLKFGQVEREEGPQSHKAKQGTPTMGGLMFVFGAIVAALCFGLSGTEFLLPTLLVMVAFGLVGFLDDFIKVKLHRNLGLRAYQKIIAQVGVAFLVAWWAYRSPLIGSELYLPISGKSWDIGLFYIPLVMFVILAEVNAVNLTDGLDGLASGVTMIYAVAMSLVFLILASGAKFLGETLYGVNLESMAVFCGALAGGLLGFLRFNTYPAKVFMGDTGSMALGGAVSMMAILSRSIILLPLMGICFVGSALSVVLQVGSYKLRHGKRIFKMAPLHHHFELLGHPETRIVSMYILVTAVACALGLLSYTFVR
ncbi:MAG: phospho-N-acetylmuramoyl-pentapeptide-transferase [Clostridia bacterium]|nr:phospho-N-acetylmuramoyl-pentapeptide-transferase [Clostridia bacterium]